MRQYLRYRYVIKFIFQVKDFNIAEGEEDISIYARYVGKIIFIIFILSFVIYFYHHKLLYYDLHVTEKCCRSAFMLGRCLASMLSLW